MMCCISQVRKNLYLQKKRNAPLKNRGTKNHGRHGSISYFIVFVVLYI